MFITRGDARIFAVSFGATDAPAILGVGGWIGSWELWAEPFAILSQRWRTIAYDHRGAGATVAAVESICHDVMVDDVFAVLDAFQVEQCVLAAESAGAQAALGAALADPQRIHGLVIVSGMVQREAPVEQDLFLLGLHKAYGATLDRFVAACVTEHDSEHIKRWGRQILDRASPGAAIALYRSAGEVDLAAKLPQIQQPALILHGEHDAIVPVADAVRLAELLPNARLQVLPGAGHVPTMTRPAEVAQAITEFLVR